MKEGEAERYQTFFFFFLVYFFFSLLSFFTRYDHDGFRRGKRAWRYRTWAFEAFDSFVKG